MRKPPILETLRVTSPCRVPWHQMTGNERVRRCDTCKQNVFNISEMTRAAADELIGAKHERMCMRYYHRADGTILLRDGAVEYRPTSVVAAAAVALALSGAALWHARDHVLPPPAPALTPAPPSPSIAPQEPIYVTGGPPPPYQRE